MAKMLFSFYRYQERADTKNFMVMRLHLLIKRRFNLYKCEWNHLNHFFLTMDTTEVAKTENSPFSSNPWAHRRSNFSS